MSNTTTPTTNASYANAVNTVNPNSLAVRICSYCRGAPEGGPPNHFWRQCALYSAGLPSRNPQWNYAQSGPPAFQTAGGVFAPMQQSVPSAATNEVALVLQRLEKLERIEADKIAAAAAEAEAKRKKEEWETQLREVRDTCVESARREMSPLKKAFELLKEAYPASAHLVRTKLAVHDEEEEEGEIAPPPKKRVRTSVSDFNKPANQNPDKDSVFRHVIGFSKGGQHMNNKHCLALMSVTTGDEFQAWVDKHVNEESDRAFEYLASIASERNIDVRHIKKLDTLIAKIVKDYDDAAASIQ